MSSRLSVGPRRRRRVEDDSDSQDERSARGTTPFSQSSNGSKRPRIEAPDETDTPASENDQDNDEGSADKPVQKVPLTRAGLPDGYNTHGDFQPGAIVRIKLKDFVTYTSAEFFPGPKLNMVIGPNGTGKSTLVCAICLGLGWGPQVSVFYEKTIRAIKINLFSFLASWTCKRRLGIREAWLQRSSHRD